MPGLALLAVGASSLQVGVSLTPLLFPIQSSLCASHTVPFTSRAQTPASSAQEQPRFTSLHNRQTKMCQRANQIKLSQSFNL